MTAPSPISGASDVDRSREPSTVADGGRGLASATTPLHSILKDALEAAIGEPVEFVTVPPPAIGDVTWHSSEEDGGPDVGLELCLGDGQSLYLGELADATIAESGAEPGGMGWWWALETPCGFRVVGSVADQDAARELFDVLTAAVRQGAAAPTMLEALKVIADESVFSQQRFAEDTDTDYFLRCFRAVKERARAAIALATTPQTRLDNGGGE